MNYLHDGVVFNYLIIDKIFCILYDKDFEGLVVVI